MKVRESANRRRSEATKEQIARQERDEAGKIKPGGTTVSGPTRRDIAQKHAQSSATAKAAIAGTNRGAVEKSSKLRRLATEFEAAAAKVREQANRKRSEAASEGRVGRAAAKAAEFSPATNGGDTKRDRDHTAERQRTASVAKAAIAGTNRGAVEKSATNQAISDVTLAACAVMRSVENPIEGVWIMADETNGTTTKAAEVGGVKIEVGDVVFDAGNDVGGTVLMIDKHGGVVFETCFSELCFQNAADLKLAHKAEDQEAIAEDRDGQRVRVGTVVGVDGRDIVGVVLYVRGDAVVLRVISDEDQYYNDPDDDKTMGVNAEQLLVLPHAVGDPRFLD